MLFEYQQQTQRLLADPSQAIFNIDDLTYYINVARAEVAAQGQCIRRISPVSGSILTVNVTNPGSDYTAPVVSITPPDSPSGYLPYPQGAQATAAAQIIAGKISNIGVMFGGGGYWQPEVTITDPTGSGATAVATVTPVNQTTIGQEVYAFSDIPILMFPGCKSILSVRGVNIVWSEWSYALSWVGYSKYNALVRQYVSTFFAPPTIGCQVGQGTDGTIHMYPLPDQPYQLIFDACCLPADLQSDQDYEAIPDPWRHAVPYFASHLALLGRSSEVPQMLPLASTYFNSKDGGLFVTHMKRARAFSNPGRVSSFYGRVG
jgi:hypothetical protein